MSSEIVVAIIALIGTSLGTFGGIVTANRLTNYRIEQLEKKVDKHNDVIERVFQLEKNDEIIFERIENIFERMGEMKHEKGQV